MKPSLTDLPVLFCTGNGMTETNLYFGRNRPDEDSVNEAERKSCKKTYTAGAFKESAFVTNLTGHRYDWVAKHRRLQSGPSSFNEKSLQTIQQPSAPVPKPFQQGIRAAGYGEGLF